MNGVLQGQLLPVFMTRVKIICRAHLVIAGTPQIIHMEIKISIESLN